MDAGGWGRPCICPPPPPQFFCKTEESKKIYQRLIIKIKNIFKTLFLYLEYSMEIRKKSKTDSV
jgi:hypothetical protein